MPTPSLPELGDNPSSKQITDYVVKLQRDLDWLLQNLDDLNVKRIRADSIYAGTIDASVVTIRSDLTGGAYVKIDGTGMVINNGVFDTLTADIHGKLTLTEVLVQSRLGYPKLELDPDSNLFSAYASATEYVQMSVLDPLSSTPALLFVDMPTVAAVYLGSDSLYINAGRDLTLQGDNIILDLFDTSSGYIQVPGWSSVLSVMDGETLQTALAGKASVGMPTGPDGAHNHGIPFGTQLMVVGGGSVTWVPAGTHTHVQS
ncbi:hypothetical protein M3223_04035 [Paenibacillus pasadenensis]|uniref:hypothetical protein n=1 Tax=Paenibacillus pasadenensis TaxID=217090 RepID=UPI00203DA04B|nr:hypothetical protein [Paenibacillus pasadenensis]MCM3746518.1 hypothetical protein [Paenibacillus pasadenensis]